MAQDVSSAKAKKHSYKSMLSPFYKGSKNICLMNIANHIFFYLQDIMLDTFTYIISLVSSEMTLLGKEWWKASTVASACLRISVL